MTVRDDFDRLLTVWLDETAGVGAPDYLDETLDGLARLDQRPAWMSPGRWLPMQLQMTRVAIPRFVPILIVVMLLIAALVAVSLIAGAPRPLPTPFGLADNGRIAYVSGGQIWTAQPDGSDARMLSAGDDIKGLPLFSRDGSRLAFLAYRDPARIDYPSLVVVDADGSDPVTIVEDAQTLGHVGWSPDGSTIAFSKWIVYNGQRDRIFLAPSDGSSPAVQVGDPDLSAFYPTFSPDGERIAFVSDHYPALCSQGDCLDELTFALHVMARDGSDLRTLARGPIQPRVTLEIDRSGRSFDWTPDGQSIVFAGVDAEQGAFGLYVVDTDGGTPHRVDDGLGAATGASVDPTGARIAYLRGRSGTDEGPWDVVVAGIDGRGPRTVATDVARYLPQWSPDGTTVAVIGAVPGGGANIRLIPLDGGPPTVIPLTTLEPDTAYGSGLHTIAWQRLGLD